MLLKILKIKGAFSVTKTVILQKWNKVIITVHDWHDNERNRSIKDIWGGKCSSEDSTMKLQIKAHKRIKATYV